MNGYNFSYDLCMGYFLHLSAITLNVCIRKLSLKTENMYFVFHRKGLEKCAEIMRRGVLPTAPNSDRTIRDILCPFACQYVCLFANVYLACIF